MAEQPTETVPKADLDKVRTDLETLQAKLLDPEYISFLEAKRAPKPSATETAAGKVNLASLTIDDLQRLIAEGTTKSVQAVLRPIYEKMNQIDANQELEFVRGKYEDFGEFAAQVQTILTNTPNDITIEQAYLMAKATSAQEPAESGSEEKPAEKAKTPTEGAEKPGGTVPLSDDSVKTFKNPEEAGRAAWGEVQKRYGLVGDSI